jgi:TRAP-type transport system small permease protein
MNYLERLTRVIGHVSLAGGVLSFISLLAFVMLNFVEISMRTLTNTSLLITDEFSGWLLVWMAFTGMGWTLRENGHIQIDLITRNLSEKGKSRAQLFVSIISLILMLFFTAFTMSFLADTYSRNLMGVSVLRFPLWLPIAGMAIGSSILTLQFLGILLRNLIVLKKPI